MSLLFDQNLSRQLPKRVAHLFPDCSHTALCGLSRASDTDIWEYAKTHGFAIVTYDFDYVERSQRLGQPPKVIHITTGNLARVAVEEMIHGHAEEIRNLLGDDVACLLELP